MARPKLVTDREALAAAARVIGRRGPVDFTIREVAQEAGLAPATIMQRFRTKRGLLLALEVGSRETLAEAFDAAEREADSPAEAIVLALTRCAAVFRSSGEMANHLAFLAVGLNDPELARHSRAYFALFRARLKALLAKAQRQGDIGPSVDLDEQTMLLEVAYNGALTTWAIEREGPLPELLGAALRAGLPLGGRQGRGARGKARERTVATDARSLRATDPDP